MNQHHGFKIFITILCLIIILPLFYLAYDRSQILPPPPASWLVPTPYYTPGQPWEQYATEYLKRNPPPNALSHYMKAMSLVTWNFPGSYWDEVSKILKDGWYQSYPQVDKILKANQPAIQEAILGAQMKQCELPPIPLNYESYKPPNYLRLHNVGKMIVLKGKKLEYQKKYHEALMDYICGIQFGKDMNQKSQYFFSLLISHAIIQMNTKPLLRLIAQDKLSESDYKQIIKELPKVEKEQVDFPYVLEREYRTVYIGKLKQMSNPFKIAKDFVNYSWATVYPLTLPAPKTTMDDIKNAKDIGLYTGYIFFNENRITRNLVGYYADMLSAATTKTYHEFMQINWVSKLPKDWINRIPPVFPLPPFYTQQMTEFSFLRLAQVEAAIHLYHLKNKQWPKGLKDLEPDYITKVPMDPFVDKPFQWSQDSGVPFVYSVGPDFIDDSVKIYYDPTNGTVSGGDIKP